MFNTIPCNPFPPSSSAMNAGGGGGGGGDTPTIQKKQKEYEGDGTTSLVVDFGEETPLAILAIYPKPNESITSNDYNMIDCFSFGQILLPAHWSVRSGNVPTAGG